MPAAISVPPALDDYSFEDVLGQLALHSPEDELVVDARACTYVSPFGFTAMLALAEARAVKPTLLPPDSADQALYWARAGFFGHAAKLYRVDGAIPAVGSTSESPVLLEVTAVSEAGSLDRIHRGVLRIATERIHMEPRVAIGIADGVLELCTNVVRHAGSGGWAMIQAYQYRKRLGGRHAMVIAVCDSGFGVRRSLESGGRRPANGRWSDAAALEAVLTRDLNAVGGGRGLGLLRACVHRAEGKLSMRSGTARFAAVPPWDDDLPMRENLAPFSGTQVQVIIPEGA